MTPASFPPPIRWRPWTLGGVLAVALLVGGFWIRGQSAEHQWSLIEIAIALRQWPEAEARLKPWVRHHPEDGKAWLRLGGVLSFQGRDEAAVDAFQHVATSDPAWSTARMLIGENAVKHHDLRAAERAFRAVAERSTTAVEPRRRLVYLLTLSQRQEEARTILWDLYRLTGDPRHLATVVGLATAEGDTRDLTRELEVFSKESPDDPWLKRAWGLMMMRVGRPAEARPLLEGAAALFDDDPSGRLALAESQIALADLGAAETTLGTRPHWPSREARWWLLRGDLQAARGQTDEAARSWRHAIQTDPAERMPNYRLAQALVRQGRPEEARPFLERVETLRVQGVERSNALDRFMRGERTVELTASLGKLCRETGLLPEAQSWFEETIRIDPTSADARDGLSTVDSPTVSAAPIPRLRPRTVAAATAPVSSPPQVPGRSVSHPFHFEEVAGRSGIQFQYDCAARGDMFLGDTMGGGVGLIDHDGDGWLDIYFVNGCTLPYDRLHPSRPNKLYRNRGDGTFEDVTERAGAGGSGYGMGCAVGDYDNDGFDDLFVTGLAETVLYRNRGDGTFEDVTQRAGVQSSFWTTAAGFGDLDGDGDLDLVVVSYVAADPANVHSCPDASGQPIHCPPGQFAPQPDVLFRNDGDGTFTDVSKEAGLDRPGGDGLGLAIADFDEDGRLDLFVANDAAPNFLFRNLGGLRFEEVGTTAGVAYDGSGRATASMGVVADDLDGDGRIDLFHTNFINEGSTLLRNLGGGQFLDATARSGLGAPSRPVTGFGTAALDVDNDGILDLFAANGHVDDRPWINHPMAQRPHFYRASAPGSFALAEPPAPYFARAAVGRGAAAGDLDNDGRLDLVVVHRDQPVALLRNTTPGGHWLGLRLIGGRSGKTAVGARVTCRAGGRTTVRWLTSGTSYLAASDPRVWFGLGAARFAERLEVSWPSRLVQSWNHLAADRILELREGSDPTPAPAIESRSSGQSLESASIFRFVLRDHAHPQEWGSSAMRSIRRPIASVVTAASLWILAGCAGSPPSVDTSTTEATVKGVVKVDGVPATEGEIVFDPSNYKRKDAAARTAPIGPDGTYTIKTLTGENQVKLGGSLAQKKPLLSRVQQAFEVHPGENTFDFEAKAK